MIYTPRRRYARKQLLRAKKRRNRLWLALFVIFTGIFLMRYTVSKENLSIPDSKRLANSSYSAINQAAEKIVSKDESLTAPKIVIDISDQLLTLYDNDQFIKEYVISSSMYGIGSQVGSNKTPLGKHVIEQKIGDGVPKNTIFKARMNTGKLATVDAETDDLVTSRIMWLKGLEKGKNLGQGVDSYKRYIYIHGTPEESKIGTEASHGCIRMLNDDVIELFNLVSENTPVEIVR